MKIDSLVHVVIEEINMKLKIFICKICEQTTIESKLLSISLYTVTSYGDLINLFNSNYIYSISYILLHQYFNTTFSTELRQNMNRYASDTLMLMWKKSTVYVIGDPK